MRGPRAALLGHNLLGGWTVLASMSCVTGLALTGWLCTSDAFFGDGVIERVHGVLAWALLGLVVVHVAGLLVTSLRHRENPLPRCPAVRSAHPRARRGVSALRMQ